MAGFSVADFFATLSIKADTKEVAKIETALGKVNKSLKMIGANSIAQANKMDKAFSGDILKKKKLQVRAAHDALKKMGVGLVDFKSRLAATTKDSEFLKISNEIKEATLDAKKLKGEVNNLYKSKKLVGDLSLDGRDPTSPFGAAAKQTHLNTFTQSDKYLDQDKQGRQLLMGRNKAEIAAIRAEAKSLEALGKTADEAYFQLKALTKQQDRTTRASKKASEQLKKQNQIMQRMRSSALQLASSFIGAFAVFESVRSINRVGQDFEGMRAAMIVDKEAVRLGLDLRATTDAYSKLQFAAKGNMSRKQTQELFVGYSEFATSLKVDPERQKGGLRAIQQMLSKTTVTSEELKSQLAEQVPGSIQIFAEAAGVGTKELFKMMEAGTLVSADILPKVGRAYAKAAREGGALGEALKTVAVQQGKFNAQLQKSQDTVFKSGFGEGYASILSNLAESMKGLKGLSEALGGVFHILFKSIAAAFNLIAIPLKVISHLLSKVKEVAGEVGAGFALLLMVSPMFFRVGLAIKSMVQWLIALRLVTISMAGAFAIGFWPLTGALLAIKEIIALLSDDVIGDLEVAVGKDFSLDNLTGKEIGSKTENSDTSDAFLKGAKAASMALPFGFMGTLALKAFSGGGSQKEGTKTETNFNAPITVVANNPEEFRSKMGDIATAQAQI